MNKILLICVLLPVFAYAKSYLVSTIPLPKTYIQNLDPYPCSESCMEEYLENGMIFSFLSHATTKLENSEQDEIRAMNVAILNLGSTSTALSKEVKIAMLLPYNKIGKYAASTTNAALSYLMSKNHAFNLKSYKIESESAQEIQRAIQLIQQDGFEYVIAPLTQEGVNAVSTINPTINIYVPTINKKDSNTQSPFLFFGGIDYEAQSDLLIQEAVSPLVIFYDQSSIGARLAMYEENRFKDIPNKRVIKYSIPGRTTNLSQYLQSNSSIQNASFFINTPIVKTGMIMSQITLYEARATNILSTQINYDPLLLSMTQYEDRKKMIVANSITEQNNILIETNSLLSNDIVYDWINYTTTIGLDYFFSIITAGDREYNMALLNNQFNHSIELLKPTRYRFIQHLSTLEE